MSIESSSQIFKDFPIPYVSSTHRLIFSLRVFSISERTMTTAIPSPPGLPLLGNVFDVDPQNPRESLNRLADIYGTSHSLLGAFQSRV